jgi:hypothetical protein
VVRAALIVAAIVVAGVLAPVQASALPILNASFESGLLGWTTIIPPGATTTVVGSHAGTYTTYLPIHSGNFAVLETGSANSYNRLEQQFSIAAGGSVNGFAAFDAGDYMPYDDNAQVQILDSTGAVVATLFDASVSTVGDYVDGPWASFGWNAPYAGVFTLNAQVANMTDGQNDSYLLLDGILGYDPVPFPPSLVLVAVGLAGAAVLGRKRLTQRE